MAHWVTVWRAAHLVGVPRGVLQQRVRAGELELNDGLVSTDALLRLYPQAQLEESGLLERVAQIRDEAFGRRVRERLLPSQEVLAQRLFRQSQEVADLRRHLQRYHALVLDLRDHLDDAAQGAALRRRLDQGLAKVLATESVDMLDVMDDMLKVMSAQVTLRPSGHQYVVEGRDTLLQAGMKAGLKLNYGCGNGSCGMCKVRVTAGEVSRVMPSDYPLSEAERAQGYVLACVARRCSAASSGAASAWARIASRSSITSAWYWCRWRRRSASSWLWWNRRCASTSWLGSSRSRTRLPKACSLMRAT